MANGNVTPGGHPEHGFDGNGSNTLQTDSSFLHRQDDTGLSGVFGCDCGLGTGGRKVCLAAVQDGPDDLDQTFVPVDDVPLGMGDKAGSGEDSGN